MEIHKVYAVQVGENKFRVVILPKASCPRVYIIEADSEKKAIKQALEKFERRYGG